MLWAKSGDTVTIHYTGKLVDGTVFDSSIGRDPLQFTIGQNDMMPGLEEAVVGMEPGQSKTTTIPSEKAYGPYREEMVGEMERSEFPEKLTPEVGQQLVLNPPEGGEILLTVVAVSESSVTLDANHPLAGQDLTFDIEMLEII